MLDPNVIGRLKPGGRPKVNYYYSTIYYCSNLVYLVSITIVILEFITYLY